MIGPSNPLISIDPILAVPGMREALAAEPAPVVAVSPIVGGEVLKGPTAAFMAHAGRELSARGIAAHYGGLLDGLVADERLDGPADVPPAREPADGAARLAACETATRMDDAAARARLAGQTLRFADSLR